MTSVDSNVLAGTEGYLVADVRGRVVGRVERATVDGAGRLTVRGGLPFRRRSLVLAADIEEIDQLSGVIALRVDRGELRSA